jgi:hypothetical protein
VPQDLADPSDKAVALRIHPVNRDTGVAIASPALCAPRMVPVACSEVRYAGPSGRANWRAKERADLPFSLPPSTLPARVWLVGGGGVDLEEFFLRPARDWFAWLPNLSFGRGLTFHLAEA